MFLKEIFRGFLEFCNDNFVDVYIFSIYNMYFFISKYIKFLRFIGYIKLYFSDYLG